MIKQQKTILSKIASLTENLEKEKTNSIPVIISTLIYCQEIFSLHWLHLPLKNMKLTIGIL